MTPAEYLQSLREVGFNEVDAQKIFKLRQSQNRKDLPSHGSIRMQATEGDGEILIYEFLGFDLWEGGGLTPRSLTEQLAALGKLDRLTIRMNSPGGDVFDAMTMFNIFRRQEAKVSVEVEGLAASAASYLTQVADPGELRVSEAGMFMVHRAWGVTMGNYQDMLDSAAVLEKMDQQIAGIYAGRSRRRRDTWIKYMDGETWFTGAEAVEAGLADKVIPAKRAAACLHAGIVEKMPKAPAAWLAQVRAEKESQDQQEAMTTRLRLMELEEMEAN